MSTEERIRVANKFSLIAALAEEAATDLKGDKMWNGDCLKRWAEINQRMNSIKVH